MSSATGGLDTQSGLRRTHRAGEITAQRVGDEVVLGGWVQRRRDHGGVIFVDLRDRDGLVQVVFKPDTLARVPRARRRAALGVRDPRARRACSAARPRR